MHALPASALKLMNAVASWEDTGGHMQIEFVVLRNP